MATRRPPSSCCRWSTTSCAGWPPRRWPRRSRARRSRPRPWSTRPISAWWTSEQAQHWDGRGHFFAAAAEAMRRILVEQARRKAAREARRRLAARRPRRARRSASESRRTTCSPWTRPWTGSRPRTRSQAELVKLRYFAGLTHRRGGRGARRLAGNRRPALGLRPRLAAAAICEGATVALKILSSVRRIASRTSHGPLEAHAP